MPRGNDSASALADLRGQYAGASGNAEDLIEAARVSMSPELRTALLTPRDQEGTEDIQGRLDEVQKKIDDGTVVDASVRGNYVVAVVESKDTGRTFKVALDFADFGGSKRPEHAVAEPLTDEEEARRAEHIGRMEATAEAADAARVAEEKAQKAAEKAAGKDTPAKK